MTPMASKPPITCLELAQEGERLCRDNNFIKGIEYLQKAIDVGTTDVHTLSPIYSQLGNAYFSIRAYAKALEYHKNDLLLTRFIGDYMGELKASANVGHTYKAIGEFQEAILFTKHQLKLAQKLEEGREKMMCEARALYNLATIYQVKSRTEQKSICVSPPSIEGIIMASNSESDETTIAEGRNNNGDEEQQMTYLKDLNEAILNYKASLELSEMLPDTLACGRTYGCLGNAYYMLRDFRTAIDYHFKRLETARQFGDKGAMRRAYTSLGNAHVFLPDMEKAIEFYRLALALSIEMKDALSEAQACFSLGNAASIVADHTMALEHHHRHLLLARALDDRAGEARAYSSLSGDLRALGDYPKAVYFLALRRRMAKEMHDDSMVETTNEQLRTVIGEAGGDMTMIDEHGEIVIDNSLLPEADSPPIRLSRSLRSLHSDMDDCGLSRSGLLSASDGELATSGRDHDDKEVPCDEDFFDLLTRMQSKRLDEQRCDPVVLSDMTNRRARQTDQVCLSPSVSVSSIPSRRLSLSRRLLSRVGTLSRSSLSSKDKKSFDKGSRGRGGGGGSGSIDKQSMRSVTSPTTSTSMNGRGGDEEGGSIHTDDGDQRSIDQRSPSARSTSTGSRSFVNLHSGLFKVPRFPSRRSTKKLTSSSSLPEHEETPQLRRHSLYARPMTDERNGPEAIMDMIMAVQGRRMEEQRATLLPGLSDQQLLQKLASEPRSSLEGSAEIDDHLYELVLNAQRGRIDDQRSELGGRRASESIAQNASRRPMTIPEDDISELVARMQAGRMDEQRAVLKPVEQE